MNDDDLKSRLVKYYDLNKKISEKKQEIKKKQDIKKKRCKELKEILQPEIDKNEKACMKVLDEKNKSMVYLRTLNKISFRPLRIKMLKESKKLGRQ